MCGISGLLPAQNTDPAELESRVRAMTTMLVHRGPDDEGLYISPAVALGMRRLAIIDVARGAQPMRSHDGRITLVFNGEIYNYRAVRESLRRQGCVFHTESDTEVLLRVLECEGLAGVHQLEGMFAFAAWDERARRLTLARDWMGQKSLYLAQTPMGLAFASEMKALCFSNSPSCTRSSIWRCSRTTCRCVTCQANPHCSAACASCLVHTR
jgi:asparagine synthase (glutamine-hydrolysing)